MPHETKNDGLERLLMARGNILPAVSRNHRADIRRVHRVEELESVVVGQEPIQHRRRHPRRVAVRGQSDDFAFVTIGGEPQRRRDARIEDADRVRERDLLQ